ncbi:MAG TPA: ADOP family duplicated permease [Bryobacteraceae bacterium]|jgi:putative ABC transport system permease protein|nr:ADOP family duplicated permease [Bryobacteraceae bacterium]
MSSLAHSLRRLRRAPAFTLTALLTLGLGIGANASIFSAIYSLLLKPLPYREPEKLVSLSLISRGKTRVDPSLLTITDWRGESRTLESAAGGLVRSFGLTVGGGSVSVVVTGMVTAELPSVLGIQPALGRLFTRQEETGNARVAILTDSLWRRRFGADTSVLGRPLELNEEPRTIIGILPPAFEFPLTGSVPDLLIPINHADYGRLRGPGHLQAVGRLRSGVDPRQAQAELQAIVERLARTYPQNAGLGAAVEPLEETLRGANRRPLLLLAASGLLLLLIACANVVNLLLAQFLVRARELAIRVSLGAGAGRLAREFFADGLSLSALGAAAGLALAVLLQGGLPAVLLYAGVRAPKPVELEPPVFLFALVTLLLTALLFTLVPAALARSTDLNPLLKESASPSGPRSFLRSGLVVVQVALSMTLLLGAGLLLRSFVKVMSVDPGFRASQVFQFGVGIPEARYDTERKMVAFHQQVLRNLNQSPGVESAAFSSRLPLAGTMGTDFEFVESPVDKERRPRAGASVVTPDFFRVLSIPLHGGRGFTELDHPDAPRVALVNEAFVRAYTGGRSPLGRRIRTGFQNGELNPGGAVSEIVGVVGDVRQRSLEVLPQPQVYLCGLQYGLEGGSYIFRAAGTPAALSSTARDAVASVDGRLQSIRLRAMSDVVALSQSGRRSAALLSGLLALVALALTAVGIYGVVSFLAAQRIPEMSIRLALGARPWQVTRLIVEQGVRLAAIGIVTGAVASLWAASLLRAGLYETPVTDPLTMLASAALLLSTAIAACLGPAARAGLRDVRSNLR